MTRYYRGTWLIAEDAKGKLSRVAAFSNACAKYYRDTGNEAELADMLAWLTDKQSAAFKHARRWWIVCSDSVWACYRAIDGGKDKGTRIIYQWDRR